MNLYKFHSNPKSLYKHDEMHDIVPALIQKELKGGKEPTPGQLKTIKRSPELSYWYARHILEDEWPPGEKAIATDAHFAYAYAHDVVERPWPEGEAIIATNGWWAFEYAYHMLLVHRFPLGEKAIAKDYKAAFGYAKYVIKDKWPPGEKIIATNKAAANDYNNFLLTKGYKNDEFIPVS